MENKDVCVFCFFNSSALSLSDFIFAITFFAANNLPPGQIDMVCSLAFPLKKKRVYFCHGVPLSYRRYVIRASQMSGQSI